MIVLRCTSANPGHLFACCGLFELASRLDGPGVLAHFGPAGFALQCRPTLVELLRALQEGPIAPADDPLETDAEPGKASPIAIGGRFNLRLDWWTDRRARDLKVWAGTMDGPSIFRSMVKAVPLALPSGEPLEHGLLDHQAPVADADEPSKKKEPFYFDARRGEHADPRDIGFSPNAQDLRTDASPAVEALTLVGLQRFRPRPADKPRQFTYAAWAEPLPVRAASVAVCTPLAGVRARWFRFESAFRTAQRKHKAFLMASPFDGEPT